MNEELFNKIAEECQKDERIVFAYLYGSALVSEKYRDIDIAVHAKKTCNPFELTSDLKESLYRRTGITSDIFDVQIINEIPAKGDIFAILFLKEIFSSGKLLVDKSPILRADFMEDYSRKYKECEGMIAEVLR